MCLKNTTNAISCFNRALELNPNFIPSWIHKGIILGKYKKYQESIDCFDKVLELDPENVNALVSKAVNLGQWINGMNLQNILIRL